MGKKQESEQASQRKEVNVVVTAMAELQKGPAAGCARAPGSDWLLWVGRGR